MNVLYMMVSFFSDHSKMIFDMILTRKIQVRISQPSIKRKPCFPSLTKKWDWMRVEEISARIFLMATR